jgi:chromosome segregation ATPase
VAVPAGGTASVTVVDERPDLKHYALVNLDRNALMELVGVIDGVDDRIAATLKELTVLRASAAAAERRREAATQELTAITSDQSRVRSNLSSVPPQSELARRYLALLTEQEDQVEAAKQAQAAATAAQESIEAQIREAVHKLSES